jgi:hypothetical protein
VTVIRAGAVVRVAAGEAAQAGRALALAMGDLQFGDGRVERWIGPGRPSDQTFTVEDGAALVAFGLDVFLEQADALAEELAEAFGEVVARALLEVPREVVVEWNRDLPPELSRLMA